MRHLLKNPQRSSAVKVASTQVIKSAMGPPDQKYQIAGRIVLDGSGRLAQINDLNPAAKVFARQQDVDKGVGDLFGRHGVKRAKLARDERAQVLAQLRGLPTAVHTLEALLRLCPVFLSALETRVAGLG